MSALPYNKSLDGIRGIAVLMVVFYHSYLLPIGWIGVQFFFVLSGFLITSILMAQADRPFKDFLGGFYWRRGLRIWPLYFLFLALCAVAYIFIRLPETWPTAWGWLVSFDYNMARVNPGFKDSDYFGHFWTLCVEEQFYLAWPLVLFFLPRRYFGWFVLLVVLAGPGIRWISGLWFAQYFDKPTSVLIAVHNMPTSHLDAFASGALLAVMPADLRSRLASKAGLFLFIAVAVMVGAGLLDAWFLKRNGLPPHWLALGYGSFQYFQQYVWAYSLLNLIGACLILCALEDNRISRLLSFRPLVFVGMISYGVYLWHFPLLHIFDVNWPNEEHHSPAGLARFGIYVLVTLAVAAFSYFCYERYFLRMKKVSLGSVFRRKAAPAAKGSVGEGVVATPPTR